MALDILFANIVSGTWIICALFSSLLLCLRTALSRHYFTCGSPFSFGKLQIADLWVFKWNVIQFNVIYIASVTIKMISRFFTERGEWRGESGG